VVARAAQSDQEIMYTTLGELGKVAAAARAPSLLLAGWAVRNMSHRGTAVSQVAAETA
jgi:siroheme synthase